MDHNSIIDKTTFEIYPYAEDYPNIILCDRKIAPTIATLNKKGYLTTASCQGHYLEGCNEQFNVDLSFLEEVKNNKHYFIKEIREDSFDCYSECMCTTTYLLFEKKHIFEEVPEGYELIQNDRNSTVFFDGSKLEHKIYFFDENNRKKSRKEIDDEIDKYCEILNKWAEKLPYNKSKN